MKMVKRRVSVNEKEAWGMLHYDRDFDACIGARFADNRNRDFGIFGNRVTMVGEDAIVNALHKWLFSKKTINAIKRNTSFSYYGGDQPSYNDRNCWATSEIITCKGFEIQVIMSVRCQGEYVYIAAYASRIPSDCFHLEEALDRNEEGKIGYRMTMPGRCRDFPVIYAKNKLEAMNILLDYIANELDRIGVLM